MHLPAVEPDYPQGLSQVNINKELNIPYVKTFHEIYKKKVVPKKYLSNPEPTGKSYKHACLSILALV